MRLQTWTARPELAFKRKKPPAKPQPIVRARSPRLDYGDPVPPPAYSLTDKDHDLNALKWVRMGARSRDGYTKEPCPPDSPSCQAYRSNGPGLEGDGQCRHPSTHVIRRDEVLSWLYLCGICQTLYP